MILAILISSKNEMVPFLESMISLAYLSIMIFGLEIGVRCKWKFNLLLKEGN